MSVLHRVSPATTAIYIICLFMASIDSRWILIGGVGLGISLTSRFLAPNKNTFPRIFLVLVFLLCIGNYSAVLGAVWWGNGNWALTFSSVFWILPAVGVMFLADERVFPWLVGFAFIHGTFILLTGTSDGLTYNSGLTHNSNVASGILVLAGIISIYKRYPVWVPLLLIAAVGFTQSRWALLINSVMILAGCIYGHLRWRWFLALGVTVILLVTVSDLTYRGYTSVESSLLADAGRDIKIRLSYPDRPDLLPHGLVEHRGLHNVPLRMARESGIITASIWIGLSVWALTQRRGSVWWWLMLGVISLSMLDHYTWRPHLGAIWFLALGGIATVYKTEVRKDNL